MMIRNLDQWREVAMQELEVILWVLLLLAIPLSIAAVKWGVSLAALVKFFSL